MFFFPPGFKVDTAKWPCPRADEGSAGCKKRFWSNHEERRKPKPEERRAYGRDPDFPLAEGTHDTFACRFYDRLARRSPCEAGFREWIVQLIVPGEGKIVDRERVGGATFVAKAGGRTTTGVTNAEGIIRVRARRDTEKIVVDLTIPPKEDEQDESGQDGSKQNSTDGSSAPKKPKDPVRVRLTLMGGDLQEIEGDDPKKTVEARLRNLGFGPALPEKWTPEVAKDALDAFKKANAIADGDDLNQKLRELHGS
jgi:hypothetical protein